MLYKVVLPSPSSDVAEVRVLEWHFPIGARVEAGELLVELETDKALVEVRPREAAYLRAISVDARAWYTLGQTLALLTTTKDEPFDSTDRGTELPADVAEV